MGFLEACKRLQIKVHVLDRRAIENYFAERAIREVFPNHPYRALAPYEPLKSLQPHWPKKHNWRIAQAMQKREFENTDLGKFLDSL